MTGRTVFTPSVSVWLALALATSCVVGLLAAYVDMPLAAWVLGQESLRAVAIRVSRFGQSHFYLVPLGIGVMASMGGARLTGPDRARRLHRLAFTLGFMFLSIAVAGLSVDLVKFLVGRARPEPLLLEGAPTFFRFTLDARFLSFPSGHASTVTALATAATLLWPQRGWWLIPPAILVAFARVGGGAHFMSDVVGGAAIAVAATLWLHGLFLRRGFLASRSKDARVAAAPAE